MSADEALDGLSHSFDVEVVLSEEVFVGSPCTAIAGTEVLWDLLAG